MTAPTPDSVAQVMPPLSPAEYEALRGDAPARPHSHKGAPRPHRVTVRHFGPEHWSHLTEVRAWRRVRGPRGVVRQPNDRPPCQAAHCGILVMRYAAAT
jgi:hypothetical protein